MSIAFLSEQLAPLRTRIVENALSRRPVLHLDLELRGDDPEKATCEARLATLRWMQRRAGKLPPAAWDHQPFEHMPGGPAALAARVNDGDVDYWIGRLDDPDKNVPGRTWTTEVSVVHSAGEGGSLFARRCHGGAALPSSHPRYPEWYGR